MQPIFSTQPRGFLRALLRPAPRSALTVLVIAAISGCTPGGGGVTPSAPPSPEGQAILAWGGNSSGQLGDNSNNQRLNPVTVPLRDLRAIAAGGDVSVGLTVDGRVLEWGGGRIAPAEITGLSGVKAIAAGERHRLALTNDGKVWAWGENDRGQLGDGTKTTRTTPVQVVGLSDVLSIAAGARHSLAIGKNFAVQAWGADDAGQLGDGKTTDSPTPVTVPGVNAIAVAAGATHSVALTTDVKVLGWGGNAECQLGIDARNDPFDPLVCSPHPAPFEMALAAGRPATWGATIAATNATTLVVTSDSQVVGFGGNGDATNFRGMCKTDLALGTAVLDLPNVREVAAGPTHALFTTSTGAVWALGANIAGQVGSGATTVVECPQEIASTRVRGATKVAAGAEHSIALIRGVVEAQPPNVDFGNQPLATTSGASTVTLTNSGLAPVVLTEVAAAGGAGEFALTENCPDPPAVLAPASTCQAQVTFAPGGAGVRSGSIGIRSDALRERLDVGLAGAGTQAAVAFAPASVDFGNQATGVAS
ncbi:MAG TPA: choice-of-anchor D domain-containing protein, partial [Gemmatimonadales bacterium]|nr:choice-of-anchor D domain-containing protein [Gemmatimonadales bacterium]